MAHTRPKNAAGKRPPQPTSDTPPVAKYRYTLTIYGNSHADIEQELAELAHGAYRTDAGAMTDADLSATRDEEFTSHHGFVSESRLEHVNPDQTPQRFAEELDAYLGIVDDEGSAA